MKTRESYALSRRSRNAFLWIFALAIFAGSLTGCGSGSQMGTPPPVGNTQVVVLVTGTANDQLAIFNTGITSIALLDRTGASTNVFTSAGQFGSNVEWMHLNGASEPFVIATVPQGTYTSAVVVAAGCSFTNVTFVQNSLTTATFDQGLCGQGTGQTTVTLPGPLNITGAAMVLSLNLQVARSYTLTGTGADATYTISPTFTLSPLSISAEPTNETNGKITGIFNQVTAVKADANNFTVQTTGGASFTMKSNATTTYQGIAGLSALAAEQVVNLDAAIQADGSLLATRVEVDDPNMPAAVIGTFSTRSNQPGNFTLLPLQLDGCSVAINPFCGSVFKYTGSTVFTISQQFSNVSSLPFPASFTATSLLQGQNISLFAPGTSEGNVDTMTLVPQTLNGTVTAISNQNGFATYTATLAAYDSFPILQNYDGPGSAELTNPTTIVVYADTSAQFLNSGMISVGSLLRFRGLVFYDNGVLRMDCGTILDGVPE
jgi:hypothetical protein